jgi:hypothetical protein
MEVGMSRIPVKRAGRYIRASIAVLVSVSAFSVTLLDAGTAMASGIGITFTGEPPASAVAGLPVTVAVSIQNDGQTITSGAGSKDVVTIGSSCALSQSSSLTETAAGGIAHFPSVTIETGSSCTLVATDTTTPHNGVIAVSSAIVVSPGPPSHLAFTVWPSPGEATAGTAVAPFTVAVEDVYDNVETTGVGSSDVITITSPCALSGTTTLSADSGIATFTDVVPSVSGACPLVATDGTRAIAAVSSAVLSLPLPSTPLKVVRVSRSVTVGTATTIAIVGRGFYGRPRVLTDATNITALVTQDKRTVLTVVVTAQSSARRGIHIFTIVLLNGKRTSVHVTVV